MNGIPRIQHTAKSDYNTGIPRLTSSKARTIDFSTTAYVFTFSGKRRTARADFELVLPHFRGATMSLSSTCCKPGQFFEDKHTLELYEDSVNFSSYLLICCSL